MNVAAEEPTSESVAQASAFQFIVVRRPAIVRRGQFWRPHPRVDRSCAVS